MKIVSTFHASSSVLASVKCNLSSRDLEHLVVAKLSRIDVYSLRTHALEHECGVDVWGKICAVRSLPLSSHETRSNIVVMITHPNPELLILSYHEEDGKSPTMVVEKSISLYERTPRLAEFFTNVLVHPSGKLAIVSCYTGKLKAITFRGGAFGAEYDILLPETNVISIAFLPTEEDICALAILYIDAYSKLQLCARDLDMENFDLSFHHSFLFQSTPLPEKIFPSPADFSLHLISVPPAESNDEGEDEEMFPGGILVVGGREILLFDMASEEKQAKQRGKYKRLEAKKKSKDPSEVRKAKEKERERENKRRKPKASVQWPWGQVMAWSSVSSRFLIGDEHGRLAMLSVDSLSTLGIILVPLGEISQPTTLTYLTNQILYVGSHVGDSQLVHISPSLVSTEDLPALAIPPDVKTVTAESLSPKTTSKGKAKATSQDDMDVDETSTDSTTISGKVVAPNGTFLSVLESYKNIAPIMDAILVDTDGSGRNQIVTCSGGANTGSVNIVRNGADFKELASISGLVGVARCWGIKTMIEDEHHSHLLVSTLTETHVLRLDPTNPATVKRLDSDHLNPFKVDQPTLAFSNVFGRKDNKYVNSSLVVQIVPTGARMFDFDASVGRYVEKDAVDVENLLRNERDFHRDKKREVVVASVNSSQVVMALNGGNIVLLRVENNREKLEVQSYASDLKREISAISLAPLNPVKEFTVYLPVAYWNTNEVEIFKISADRLHSVAKSESLPSLVRSVLLYNFGTDTSLKGENYHGYLLAGLADGSVASMTFKGAGLNELKIISLGTSPVLLTPGTVQQDGKEMKTVLAAANRAAVFFVDRKRLLNSPIMLKEIGAASGLNTPAFGSSIVLAAPTRLFIGHIGNLNKMHIRTIPFGRDNPHHLVHEPFLKVYGVACRRDEPARIGGYEAPKSTFQLIDDNTLTVLGLYQCLPEEEITAVATIAAPGPDVDQRLFCVGTFVNSPGEVEPTSGRILIFTAFANSKQRASLELSMLASEDVKGCVFSIKTIKDRIIVAVNSSIMLYQLVLSEESGITPTYCLQKLAEWNHNYMVTSLGSFEDRIVAGDQISSVSLLSLAGDKIISEARDYGPTYPIAVEALSDKDLICANDSLNLIQYALTSNLRGKSLERNGIYHIAELVSKFARGTVATEDKSKDSVFAPEFLFFTASGRISVVIDIKDNDLGLSLSNLERNLTFVVKGVGGGSHSKFRMPKDIFGPSDADKSSEGFLDGDLLEKFLPLSESPEKLKVILGDRDIYKLDLTQEETSRIIEQLQNLH